MSYYVEAICLSSYCDECVNTLRFMDIFDCFEYRASNNLKRLSEDDDIRLSEIQ